MSQGATNGGNHRQAQQPAEGVLCHQGAVELMELLGNIRGKALANVPAAGTMAQYLGDCLFKVQCCLWYQALSCVLVRLASQGHAVHRARLDQSLE